jgi:twinkle protein
VYDPDQLRAAMESLRGLVYIYNHKGYRDWMDVEHAMMYFISLGIENIFIDPLSALTAHLSSSDANTYLNNAMFVMSKLIQSSPVNIFHVNHLNNPSTGKDHGAGGKVYGSQFTGSRAMWKFSTDLWGLERDQLSDDPLEKNTVEVVIIKNRLSGQTGRVRLRYNNKTGTLAEVGPSASASSFADSLNI